MTLSDQQYLVRRVLEGNQDAATSLYNQLLPYIHSAVWRFGTDNLEEYTQLAMVKIFAKLSTWRGDSSLKVWAYRVARNEVLQLIRCNKSSLLVPLVDIPAEPSYSSQHTTQLHFEIGKLRPKRRMIMKLKLQGFSIKEIAAKQQLSISIVKAEYHRGMLDLRKVLT